MVDDSLGKFSQFLQPDDPTVDIYILGIKGGSEKYIRNIDNKDKIRSYMKECMYFPTKKANNHGIIYRMDFLKKNNILFDDRLNYGEDSEFFLKSLAYAQHICVLDIPLYKVNYNEQSAVHHANCSMVTAYKKSIYKIQQNFFDRYDLSSDKILNNALNIYILNQLLIILTHETLAEKNGNVIREIHEIKQLANTEPFKHAVSESYIYEMSSITRIVFQMLKMKFYSGVWVAVRARQTQNKLGSDNK